jgi:hypothetical protein
MAVHRPVRLPLPSFAASALPVRTLENFEFRRLHESGRDPIYFGLNPGHRFSHPQGRCGLLYLAATVNTCIWERFGDDILNPGSPVPRSVWIQRQLSKIRVSKVRVCDLTDENVRAQVGVDLSALHHTDLSVPQAWGLAVQDHPNFYDGLLYPSRLDGLRCLALFDRPGLRDGLAVLSTVDLVASDEANAFLLEKQIALL